MVRFLMGIALLFSLFGCGLFGLKFGPGDGGPEKSEPDSALSKRRVRDTNRLVKSDPSSLKKRVVVLPFIDSDLTRPQSLRDRARESFIREVNQTAPFIAINSEEIKTDVFGLFKQGE